MVRHSVAAIIGSVIFAGSALAAAAPKLVPGLYGSVGLVASNNGASTCADVGLATNSTVTSVVNYPGASKAGLVLYTIPFGGGIQVCSGFAAVPNAGLNNFNSDASCTFTTINGGPPASTVNFAFTATNTDANSSVGTTTVTIPSTASVGAGCTAVIDTTLTRTGK